MTLPRRFSTWPETMREGALPAVAALALYGAASFLLVYFLSTDLKDDAYFKEFLRDFRLEYIANLYRNWTPRLLPMSLGFYMVHVPVLFKAVTFAVLMALPLMLYSLLSSWRTASMWALVAALCMYPIGDMHSSGWVATFCNYAYVLFAMLASMCILLNEYTYGKTSLSTRIVLFLLLLFATNHEQSLIILFVFISTLLLFYYHNNGRLNALLVWSLALWVLAALNFLLCPGNENRIAFDTASFLPEFVAFTGMDKAYLGYITTAHRYFFTINILYVTFALMLAFCLCHTYGRKAIFFIPAGIPIVYTVLFTVYFSIDASYILTVASMSSPFPYFVFFSATATIGLIGIYLYLLFGMGKDLYLSLAILGLGFGSRALVGFSPVVLISPTRISLYADVALIAMIGVLYPYCAAKYTKTAAWTLAAAAALQLARNVSCVLSLGAS